MSTRPVWPASDLARRRIDILDEARSGVAFVRGTDGTLLAFTAAATFANLEQTQRHCRLLGAAVTALVDADPRPSTLGELAFVADWIPTRRHQFVADLNEVVAHAAATGQPDEIDAFLAMSKPRAKTGVIDPERIRSALLTP